jgi:hypothetical protein
MRRTPGGRVGFDLLASFLFPGVDECARVDHIPPADTSGSALYWGRGRQVMHLLCKQDHVGALPIVSTSFEPVFARTRALALADTLYRQSSEAFFEDPGSVPHNLLK